jgi:hypothetical protein
VFENLFLANATEYLLTCFKYIFRTRNVVSYLEKKNTQKIRYKQRWYNTLDIVNNGIFSSGVPMPEVPSFQGAICTEHRSFGTSSSVLILEDFGIS